MLIEPDSLNMLVDGGEMKVTSLKLTKYDRAAAKLDTSLLTGMWVKTDIIFVRLESYLPLYIVDG